MVDLLTHREPVLGQHETSVDEAALFTPADGARVRPYPGPRFCTFGAGRLVIRVLLTCARLSAVSVLTTPNKEHAEPQPGSLPPILFHMLLCCMCSCVIM